MPINRYEKHALVRFLRDPECSRSFDSAEWEQLIRSARHGQLLSRVAWLAISSGLIDHLPAKIDLHLRSAWRVAESQAESVKWEIVQIRKALAKSAIPCALLKGAAYVKGQFACGPGRLMSDVDIMVPRDRLAEVEKALCAHGWFPTKIDNYDQRYYREWMHELPPLQHLDRGANLDVHHTILPPTALLKPDVAKLWSAACELENEPGVYMLAPIDMVLHSATHLFHDGEFEHGLRDLVDISGLIGQFSSQADFFEALADRAVELNLARPLHYALKYCKSFLHAPIPDDVIVTMARHGNRSMIIRKIMDTIVVDCIGSILEDRTSLRIRSSELAMYVRSHYLRMPMRQLVPHLLRKQFLSDSDSRTRLN